MISFCREPYIPLTNAQQHRYILSTKRCQHFVCIDFSVCTTFCTTVCTTCPVEHSFRNLVAPSLLILCCIYYTVAHGACTRLAGRQAASRHTVAEFPVYWCVICVVFFTVCVKSCIREMHSLCTAHGINHVSLDVLKKLLWGCQAKAKLKAKSSIQIQVCFNHGDWWKASTQTATRFSSFRQSWGISEPIVYYKLSR